MRKRDTSVFLLRPKQKTLAIGKVNPIMVTRILSGGQALALTLRHVRSNRNGNKKENGGLLQVPTPSPLRGWEHCLFCTGRSAGKPLRILNFFFLFFYFLCSCSCRFECSGKEWMKREGVERKNTVTCYDDRDTSWSLSTWPFVFLSLGCNTFVMLFGVKLYIAKIFFVSVVVAQLQRGMSGRVS
jgi:hypothetical protein